VLTTPRVDVATPDDLKPLVQLRLDQGWRRNDALLRALMDWDGGRIFIVRAAGLAADAPDPNLVVASTSALAAGATGVIGNVVVREGYRGRGLARLVMESALGWMRERGVRTVLLDATVAGRPHYYKLGFTGVGPSWFAHAPLAGLDHDTLTELAGPLWATLRDPADLSKLANLDRSAFGGDRMGLLTRMLAQPRTWLYVVDGPNGMPSGYAMVRMARTPTIAVRPGPLVAESAGAAAALLLAAVGEDAPFRLLLDAQTAATCELYLSVAGTNPDALTFAQRAGVQLELDDLIMRLDFEHEQAASDNSSGAEPQRRPLADHPEWLYAWLAPMAF
jgi:GNAT superfamily N-acetyltransferase